MDVWVLDGMCGFWVLVLYFDIGWVVWGLFGLVNLCFCGLDRVGII